MIRYWALDPSDLYSVTAPIEAISHECMGQSLRMYRAILIKVLSLRILIYPSQAVVSLSDDSKIHLCT